jgi:hypothetical protein
MKFTKKGWNYFLLSDHTAPAYVDPSQVSLSFSVPYYTSEEECLIL